MTRQGNLRSFSKTKMKYDEEREMGQRGSRKERRGDSIVEGGSGRQAETARSYSKGQCPHLPFDYDTARCH